MSNARQMVTHSTIYAIANTSRQIVGFIMLPVYTNYLTPSDYGVVGLLVFAVSLFEMLLAAQMFQAVPKFYHQETSQDSKNAVVNSAFAITGLFSLVAVVTMASNSKTVSLQLFGSAEYNIYVQIFSALILTHSLEQYGLAYIRIIRKPWLFFWFSIAKLLLQLTLSITTIVVLEMGLMGLALSSLISSLIIATGLAVYTLSQTGIHVNAKISKKMLKFSWPLWLTGLIGLYIGSSNRYFIRVFSSIDDVGLFELASRFGSIVGLLIWMPFSQYWQTERFSVAQKKNPYPEYSLAFRTISSLLLIGGTFVNIFSDITIVIMSAPEFHSSASAVPYLTISGIFHCMIFFNNFSFMHKSETLRMTKNNAIAAIIITIFYIILIPHFGFVGAAIALMISTFLQYIYVLSEANKIYPLKIPQTPFMVSCALLLGVSLINEAIANTSLSIITISEKMALSIFTSVIITLLMFKKSEIKLAGRELLKTINKLRKTTKTIERSN
ncbi:polysaccharide biosynthesis C-terminal domain-containing protein [Marinobacter sp. chi1]|uniref:Polysaccharide biosynthesis C-terminal domain-containing protein n=1 Tax=Marinobacter suaedae TaxID=3057675 RepID=A0ABT8W2L0_9GAMM|nr:oligosaccharide flippase family protein [Marinobacter sp. chi1]MDO3722411.1 polysaccharide biosynthesis C-terminal domain-containing protein [Marinobacter sp. chi1]